MAIGKKKNIVCISCRCKGVLFSRTKTLRESLEASTTKKRLLFLYKIFTALDGIPSEYGHEVFTWFVNMMACKCMISGERVTPTARLFLALF